MFIRIRLDYNGEDYAFSINGLYSSILNGKQEGEPYISGLDARIWLNVGDGWMPLADIEEKYQHDIQEAKSKLLDLEKERLELRLTQVKHMMDE